VTGLKLAILLGFALMFAAGLAVGRAGRMAAAANQRPTADPSYLAARLNLTADQQKQMEEIWSQALDQAPDMPARIHDADAARDDEVEKFLTPDQRTKFEHLESARNDQIAALRAQRDKIMHDAQDQTRAILTPTQVIIFDQIIKESGHFSPSMRYHGAGTQP
jgi:Spy/CpxP family protein refolding chaperone